jgi:hypothetical protein
VLREEKKRELEGGSKEAFMKEKVYPALYETAKDFDALLNQF